MKDMKNVNKPIKQEEGFNYGALGIVGAGLTICGNILYPVATATIIGAIIIIPSGIF